MLFIVLLSVVTTLYLTYFWLFLRTYPILECQISGCEWEKYELSVGSRPINLKNVEVIPVLYIIKKDVSRIHQYVKRFTSDQKQGSGWF